ncbi:MAG TPA: glycosyltransferase family 1 protein [Paludibacter sp.]|nr:glycosyltransferase family 1 protein [Paludibacter sp.]
MKIFYDHYAFSFLKFGGISRYISELLKYIPKENWDTSTLLTNNSHVQSLGLIKTIGFLPTLNFRGKERLMYGLNMPYTKYKLRTSNWDVFHATWFATPYFNDVKDRPVVVTIHDLIYDIFFKDKNIPYRERIIDMGRKSAERADKVIAVSQCTKSDMIREWGIDEKKIEVIYHGVDKTTKPISSERLIENPYIFFAGGGRSLNKNFEHLIEAFALLSEKHKDLRLVCSGSNFTEAERKLLLQWKIQDKVLHYYANEQQMAQLYHDALMLVVPSYYEGFGMPILEAMVYDCPVVLSNASCFPEIADTAGVYFDPYNSEEMCVKMALLVEDNETRYRQIERGRTRLNFFSWEKCAVEHQAVYKSII